MVILVLIGQSWSIIIQEASPYSTLINCCCLWLDCLLALTLKSIYCAATLEASICHPSVCLCFTLCDYAPCWSSLALWTASNLSAGFKCCSSKLHAGWVTLQSLLVLIVKKRSSCSLSYVQKAAILHWQHRAPKKSMHSNLHHIIIVTVNIFIVPQSLISSSS